MSRIKYSSDQQFKIKNTCTWIDILEFGIRTPKFYLTMISLIWIWSLFLQFLPYRLKIMIYTSYLYSISDSIFTLRNLHCSWVHPPLTVSRYSWCINKNPVELQRYSGLKSMSGLQMQTAENLPVHCLYTPSHPIISSSLPPLANHCKHPGLLLVFHALCSPTSGFTYAVPLA